jgi:copper homeostasis protein
MCNDPFKGLEDVISTGIDRLLTSGQKHTAEEGAGLINQLIKQSGKRIIIMPGSGINSSNIAHIALTTGAEEFHLTGRKVIESEMTYRKENIHLGGISAIPEFSRKIIDPVLIKSIRNILKEI